MADDSPPEFSPGDQVRSRRDRARLGKIVDGPTRMGGRKIFRVQWEDGSLERLPATQLVTATGGVTIEELLREQAFEGHEAFVRNFTHRKLRTPVDDTLYSLNASRTRILPHQFKPLLRFLDSLHRRYLIADEVGLGKTIEAGIILSELRARRTLGGVLVVAPNHLRDKWRSELHNRFDESFEIVAKRSDFLALIEDIETNGSENRRVIVGHKTIAARNILERLEEGAPGFDLVIVDEAHYMRNPETLARRVLGEISDASNQLLLLTATPIQTHAENLLSLLRLLDQGSFRSLSLFHSRLEANRHLVQAETLLRSASPDPASIRTKALTARLILASLPPQHAAVFGLNEGGRLDRIKTGLEVLETRPDHAGVAEMARDLRELNLLTPYITRTRKSEVQNTSTRRVETVRPEPDLLPSERAFYDAVVEWCRGTIAQRFGADRVLFLSRNIERRLASSIPAFAKGLLKGGHDPNGLLGSPPTHVLELAREVPRVDTKVRWLLTLLAEIERRDPGTKILVFASFIPTLRHLGRVLEDEGVATELIHGNVVMDPVNPERDERGKAVRRFLSDPKCRVLLSSNVGGEGLDLQEASVVVNYDFPWNPAKVEQRIGRIDRFGQEKETIQIMNFLLPGTVESVIFGRLDERLHLFRQTLGDFGRILGDVVKELSEQFFRDGLTLEELEMRTRDQAWMLENQLADMNDILNREGELVAYDEDFAEQLKSMDREGLTIRPSDLVEVCRGVLQSHFPRSWLRSIERGDQGTPSSSGIFELRIDFDLHHRLRGRLHSEMSGALQRFIAKFPADTVREVTFDGEIAEKHPEILLITARHPLVRVLVELSTSGDEFHPISAIELKGGFDGNAGAGLLVLSEGSIKFGEQERRHLLPVFVPANNSADTPEISRRLVRALLDRGRSGKPTSVPGSDELVRMLGRGVDVAESTLWEMAVRIAGREEARIRPRVSELRERYGRRIATNLERASAERYRSSQNEKRLQGLEKYGKRLVRERDRKIAEIERIPEPGTKSRPVGAIWVELK